MTAAADALSERIMANLAAAELISTQAVEVAAELQKLRGRASSERDEVVVTVDHRGIVTAIDFSDQVTQLGADRLGSLVLQVTSAAIEDLRRQAQPIQAQLAVDPSSILEQDDILAKLDDLVYGRMPGATTEERSQS